MRNSLVALSLSLLVACGNDQPATQSQSGDYLTPQLREQVEALKESFRESPSDPSSVVERGTVVFDWVNAHALNGGYVPVNATQTVSRIGGYGRPGPRQVDNLIAELILIDEQPQAIGDLVAEPVGPIIAGARATFTQTYTVGEAPVQTGGGFLIAKHFNANHAPYQVVDPGADDYISIASSNQAVNFVIDEYAVGGMHGGFRGAQDQLVFRVDGADINPGDQVTLTYGDTAGGGGGLLMPDFNSDQMPFPIYLDLDGSDLWLSLPIQAIPVVGGVTTDVAGFAPSVVTPGETFEMSIRAADSFGNRALGDIPDWELFDQQGNLISEVTANNSAVSLVNLSFDQAGVYRLDIRSTSGEVIGKTNPILVAENPETRVYWGETHGHSGFAEGIGSAAAYMKFARDEARLDFVTHSEHDVWMDDGEWEILRRIVQQYNEDGRFMAYLGYEWTMASMQGGHHNVLFRTAEDRQRVSVQHFPSLSRLYQGLREQNDSNDVLIIPHAHQKGDYRISDPEMENLVEIMSMHGTFEWFGRMYLNHGHRVGFVAASDDHIGKPGYSMPKKDSLAQQGGLSAVLATEKTTDSLFNALKSLNAYATTGARIIMDVSVNGTSMGQQAPYSEERDIQGRVIGTAPIRSVTLFKNDHVQQQWNYNDVSDNELAVSFYSESYPYHPDDNPRGWRHWRGSINIEGAALASAELVDLQNLSVQSLEQDPGNPNLLTFSTLTRGDHSTVLLRFDGPVDETRVQINLEDTTETGSGPPRLRLHQAIPGQEVILSTESMEENESIQAMSFDGYNDKITLSRGGSMPLEVNFDLLDTENPRQGDYYFVRVRQQDESLAWSSPIWVGGSAPK